MFENGQEVVDYFQNMRGDLGVQHDQDQKLVTLLILDVNMPILSGNEALVQIKERFKT